MRYLFGCQKLVSSYYNYYEDQIKYIQPFKFFFLNFVCLAPSSAPVNLTLKEQGPTYALMQWSPPVVADHNGIIDYYQINLRNNFTSETISNQTTSDSRPSIYVTSLQPNTHYSCSVAAVTVASGPLSASIYFTTDQDGTALYLWLRVACTSIYVHGHDFYGHSLCVSCK